MTDVQAIFESRLSELFKLEDEKKYKEIILLLDEIWLNHSKEDTNEWLMKKINSYKAEIYLKLQEPTKALNYYKKNEYLITIDQLTDWILLKRGIANCLIQLGRIDEARSLLETLLEKEFPEGHIASGFAALKFYIEEAYGDPKTLSKATEIVESYASYFGVELQETITDDNIIDYISYLFKSVKSADLEYFVFQTAYSKAESEQERKVLYADFVNKTEVKKYKELAEKFVNSNR